MERLNPKEIYEKCATSEAFVGYMQAKMEQTIEEIGKELERHMESFSCTPREMIMFLDEMNFAINMVFTLLMKPTLRLTEHALITICTTRCCAIILSGQKLSLSVQPERISVIKTILP